MHYAPASAIIEYLKTSRALIAGGISRRLARLAGDSFADRDRRQRQEPEIVIDHFLRFRWWCGRKNNREIARLLVLVKDSKGR